MVSLRRAEDDPSFQGERLDSRETLPFFIRAFFEVLERGFFNFLFFCSLGPRGESSELRDCSEFSKSRIMFSLSEIKCEEPGFSQGLFSLAWPCY